MWREDRLGFMPDLTTIFHHLQRRLSPALTEEQGPLFALDQQFCEVISLTDIGRFTRSYEWCGNGAPPCPRLWLAHAFIAKSVDSVPHHRRALGRTQFPPALAPALRLGQPGGGPSEATFSRAFTAFAHD